MVRVLIVDDQKIVREGIKILLEKSAEIEIIGDATDGNEGLEKIEILKPDIVLLDIEMPDVSGLKVAKKIRFQFPEVKIIMLSSHKDDKYVQKATESGAKGYLLKDASSQELEWSIKLVDKGYSAIKSELLEQQFANQSIFEPDLQLDEDLRTKNDPTSRVQTLSKADQSNLNQLEALLGEKEAKENHALVQPKSKLKKRNYLISNFKLSRVKKTMSSFEFRLLIFIILFCFGFLIFIALH